MEFSSKICFNLFFRLSIFVYYSGGSEQISIASDTEDGMIHQFTESKR